MEVEDEKKDIGFLDFGQIEVDRKVFTPKIELSEKLSEEEEEVQNVRFQILSPNKCYCHLVFFRECLLILNQK